ncbi:hypothetical protein Pedsa_0723 [Pseudopedobacter saltans DSM 12145]|uniref:Secretion system C-terminal sorting domain-containing protein n=2 Tax=Pseudopedobacter saltans TaxID=151895 RepID=F0S8L5_PSESL|nr:hypothetical protein Pedsa_0723 [Pseudopedobacter saltans DSM 12145]
MAFLGITGVSLVANAQHWLGSISGPVPTLNGEYRGNHLAIDADGNTYTTGSYKSSTSTTNNTLSAYNNGQTGAGGTIAFTVTNQVIPAITNPSGTTTAKDNSLIAKTDANGEFKWMTGFGSSDKTGTNSTIQHTVTNSIAVSDVNVNSDGGAVYVGGYFYGNINSFSGSSASIPNITSSGGNDGIVMKLSKEGVYQWHKLVTGGTNAQAVTGVTTDSDGNLIAIGTYNGSATIDATTITNSNNNIFVAKFKPDGELLFVKSFNGATAWGVAADIDKSIYITGSFTSSVTFGSITLTGSGTTSYLARLDANGIPVWAKAIISTGQNVGHGVAVDYESDESNRGVYITGQVINDGTADVNFGGIDVSFTSDGASTASPYVAKFNVKTGNPVWAKVFKATGTSGSGYNVAVNTNKNVFVAGYSRNINIDGVDYTAVLSTATPPAITDDGFIVKLDSENGIVLERKFIATAGTDRVNGLAVNNTAVYANGMAGGPSGGTLGSPTVTQNFAGTGQDYAFRGGSWDIFILKWGSTSLPISLTEFKGSKTYLGNLLSWTTLSETDNQYFELERSADGINFSSIKRLTGSGTSTERINYSYLDTNPLAGINYYRLKQVDKNGTFSYSENIVAINTQLSIEGLKAYPNPGLGIVNIQLPSESDDADINVYNQAGKLVESYTNVSGSTHIVDISKQPTGVYYIQVVEKGKSKLSKYLKQ